MKIAIDGPAGAGKSTIARRLAQELGFVYIDTGAMYRALTWKALREGIPLHDSSALQELAHHTLIHFSSGFPEQQIFCDDTDVSAVIRSPRVSAAVSILASHSGVRKIMVNLQQALARSCSVVMDGRDVGECILPDAEFKFFLTASIEERVQRRVEDMKQRGYSCDMAAVQLELEERDKSDRQREMGALKILPDSIVVDTSQLTPDQVLDSLLTVVRGG